MKILAPSMQNLSSGSSGTQIASDMYNIVYSNIRPNDLENGLWIKNNQELPLLEIDSEWNRIAFDDTSEITIEDITSQVNKNVNPVLYYRMSNFSYFYSYNNGLVGKPLEYDNKLYGASDKYYFVVLDTLSGTLTSKYCYCQIGSTRCADLTNAAKVICDNFMYIFGGLGRHTGSGYTQEYESTNMCWKYDLSTYTLTSKFLHRRSDKFHINSSIHYII